MTGRQDEKVGLPVMESFYTLQGEGFHTGKPAFFIRLGGCDVGCSWCDVKPSWDATVWPPKSVDELLSQAGQYPAKALVVTGGEPLLYNLGHLTKTFKEAGYQTFIETSGCHEITGWWDWICISPKKQQPPLPGVLPLAHELKVIIEKEDDFNWAETCKKEVLARCHLFLQPEWSSRQKMMPEVIRYIKNHPEWAISLQSHKYMQIP